MKTLAVGFAASLLALAAVARGQYYGGAYVDNRASTPAEGYARGLGDVIRSQGIANLANSEAAINMTEAARRGMENRKQWTDTYFQMRDANRKYRAQERGPRPTMEDAVRYAQLGKPEQLSPSELDKVDGQISWPIILQAPQYAPYRDKLDQLFSKRATLGGVTTEDYLEINRTTKDMLAALKQEVKEVPTDAYIAAKNFIQSLAYEASHTPG